MSVKVLLTEEIEENLKALSEMEAINSDDYEKATNNTIKLIDRLNEMEKIENDHMDRKQSRQEENDLKAKQMADEKKDHIVKNVLTGISVVGGFVLTVWGTIKTIEFEKEGTVTTIIGRGFFNKLLPKK